VQVAYDSDLERAMAIMAEAARAQPRVLAEPPPLVLLRDFADSGINLELGFWVADPEQGVGVLRSDINLAIWREFNKTGISIPFPQREVRVVKGEGLE
jgi:small-conductance mechanosensitive channel